ncbi:MAG: hypothetical protein WDO15_26335 [Bacteroidota bacterium]
MVCFLVPLIAVGQDDEKPAFPLETIYAKRKPWGVRKILKNFRFSLSTGYGHTFMSHKLDGYGIIQAKNASPEIFLNTNPSIRYSNWVNRGVQDSTSSVPVDAFKVSSDSAKLRYKGAAWNIPLNAMIHYEFLQRYRIGIGYSYEYMNIGAMKPTTFKDKLANFQPTPKAGFMSKFYGMAGISFYRIDNFLFTGDIQAGTFKPGKNYDLSQIKKGLYVNAGVTIEREFSEYLKAFLRPSFEFKNYTINLPNSDKPLPHYMNAFYVNIGLTYAIPDLPKCFHPECHSQMNHVHGDREYRSRMHRIWKKQNPLYGENNPKLIKYKGKNKRKMNPY